MILKPVIVFLAISPILLLLSAFVLIPWLVHFDMTKEHSKNWGWGNFNLFLREYNKREWMRQDQYPYSYFGCNCNEDQIHASIIKFNQKGMCLNFLSFWRFQIWNHKKKLKSPPQENWQ